MNKDGIELLQVVDANQKEIISDGAFSGQLGL